MEGTRLGGEGAVYAAKARAASAGGGTVGGLGQRTYRTRQCATALDGQCRPARRAPPDRRDPTRPQAAGKRISAPQRRPGAEGKAQRAATASPARRREGWKPKGARPHGGLDSRQPAPRSHRGLGLGFLSHAKLRHSSREDAYEAKPKHPAFPEAHFEQRQAVSSDDLI
jgi:hypothetical protein